MHERGKIIYIKNVRNIIWKLIGVFIGILYGVRGAAAGAVRSASVQDSSVIDPPIGK